MGVCSILKVKGSNFPNGVFVINDLFQGVLKALEVPLSTFKALHKSLPCVSTCL